MRMKQTAMEKVNPLHGKDTRFANIYDAVKAKVNLDTLIPTCIEVAREVEAVSGASGREKLDILQRVLRQALKESKKPLLEKEQILHTIDTIVPMVVQAAVLASKHPIAAHVHAVCVGCWTKANKS